MGDDSETISTGRRRSLSQAGETNRQSVEVKRSKSNVVGF